MTEAVQKQDKATRRWSSWNPVTEQWDAWGPADYERLHCRSLTREEIERIAPVVLERQSLDRNGDKRLAERRTNRRYKLFRCMRRSGYTAAPPTVRVQGSTRYEGAE